MIEVVAALFWAEFNVGIVFGVLRDGYWLGSLGDLGVRMPCLRILMKFVRDRC